MSLKRIALCAAVSILALAGAAQAEIDVSPVAVEAKASALPKDWNKTAAFMEIFVRRRRNKYFSIARLGVVETENEESDESKTRRVFNGHQPLGYNIAIIDSLLWRPKSIYKILHCFMTKLHQTKLRLCSKHSKTLISSIKIRFLRLSLFYSKPCIVNRLLFEKKH